MTIDHDDVRVHVPREEDDANSGEINVLIKEARRRQRLRYFIATIALIVLVVAVVVGGLGLVSRGGLSSTSPRSRVTTPVLKVCPLHSLAISLPLSGAGLGHIAYDIKMRNTSQLSCTLSGYPVVVAPLSGAVPSGGPKVARASDQMSGYSGGIYGSTKRMKVYERHLPVVVLRPHGYASVVVEYGDMVRAGCPTLTKFVVTLPQGGRAETFTVSVRGDLCTRLVVHPILSGVTDSLDAQ